MLRVSFSIVACALCACGRPNPLLAEGQAPPPPASGSRQAGGLPGSVQFPGNGGVQATPGWQGTAPGAGEAMPAFPDGPGEPVDVGPEEPVDGVPEEPLDNGDMLINGICVREDSCAEQRCDTYQPTAPGDCLLGRARDPDVICGDYAVRGGLSATVYNRLTGEWLAWVFYDDTGGQCSGQAAWLIEGDLPDLDGACPHGARLDCACYDDDSDAGAEDPDADAGVDDVCHREAGWLLNHFGNIVRTQAQLRL